MKSNVKNNEGVSMVFDWSKLLTYEKKADFFYVSRIVHDMTFDWAKDIVYGKYRMEYYASFFVLDSDEELLAIVERESQCRGWTSARGSYGCALKAECNRRGLPCDFVVAEEEFGRENSYFKNKN